MAMINVQTPFNPFLAFPVNIAFVLDSSTTAAPYYRYEKKLVRFISTRLQVGKGKTKVAVIRYLVFGSVLAKDFTED